MCCHLRARCGASMRAGGERRRRGWHGFGGHGLAWRRDARAARGWGAAGGSARRRNRCGWVRREHGAASDGAASSDCRARGRFAWHGHGTAGYAPVGGRARGLAWLRWGATRRAPGARRGVLVRWRGRSRVVSVCVVGYSYRIHLGRHPPDAYIPGHRVCVLLFTRPSQAVLPHPRRVESRWPS